MNGVHKNRHLFFHFNQARYAVHIQFGHDLFPYVQMTPGLNEGHSSYYKMFNIVYAFILFFKAILYARCESAPIQLKTVKFLIDKVLKHFL
jgi:hypothetical protein